MDTPRQESARREHDGTGSEADTGLRDDTHHALAFHDQIVGRLLKDLQVGLILHQGTHRGFVQYSVGLGAGGPYRRPFAAVKNAELDTATVGGAGHHPTQGIDLLNQMPLADTADGRIAAQLSNRFDIMGQQQGAQAHARRRHAGLGAGMAAANHNHIKMLWIMHNTDPPGNSNSRAF